MEIAIHLNMDTETVNEIRAVIFAHRRIQNTIDLVTSCISNGLDDVFVFVDGPRLQKPDDLEINKRFRQEIELKQELWQEKVKVIFRESNYGCRKSIWSGLKQISNLEGNFVILEDDLIVQEGFFRYIKDTFGLMNASHYMVASGSQFMFEIDREERSLLSSTYPIFWGWGITASNLRQLIEWVDNRDPEIEIQGLIERTYWSTGRQRVQEGKLDTWDLPVTYEFVARRLQCLFPRENLVSNCGNDDFATHTSGEDRLTNLGIESYLGWNNKVHRSSDQDAFMRKKIYRIGIRSFITNHLTNFYNRA